MLIRLLPRVCTQDALKIVMYCVDQIASQSLHPRVYECVFDGFVDISEVLQPLTSTKIGWHSDFPIAVFFAVLASLQVPS